MTRGAGQALGRTMRASASKSAVARSPASRTIGLKAVRCSALGLLADDADQVAPHDLQLDAVHLQPALPSSSGRSAIRLPSASTRSRQPGNTNTVVFAFLDDHRPRDHLGPPPRAERSKTGTVTCSPAHIHRPLHPSPCAAATAGSK